MATEQRIILVCDSCACDDHDGNGPVTAHRVSIDGNSFTVDACATCWSTVYRDTLRPLTKHAARVRIPTGRGKARAAGRLTAVS